ncbi:MAG: enoyl-CoA hydratase [Deltaproteobacteria bacterium]|nr:enoyl-CoA hydratase [Deltaproteobacteria bacterium]MBW1815770.1 enoyl-CoA hydratase [Deltaproteobacteria bacterium]
MSDDERVLYETPAPHIVRIVLNRPEARNAQDTKMLYELNDAFDRAAQDNEIKVIILAAAGPHFSAGHDLRETSDEKKRIVSQKKRVGTWHSSGSGGAHPNTAHEKEVYLGFSERWRNIPKPTIAQVQGKCIAGGLMLVWPCDIIVAADDAAFLDNTVSMGVGGCEYFAHPWELGPRKAKEVLFTADWVSAEDAFRLGMVNHVVPRGELEAFTMKLAERIAAKPLFALKLAKEAVNAAQDAAGRGLALQTAFAYHQLAHSHNMQVHGLPIDPSGISPAIRKK